MRIKLTLHISNTKKSIFIPKYVRLLPKNTSTIPLLLVLRFFLQRNTSPIPSRPEGFPPARLGLVTDLCFCSPELCCAACLDPNEFCSHFPSSHWAALKKLLLLRVFPGCSVELGYNLTHIISKIKIDRERSGGSQLLPEPLWKREGEVHLQTHIHQFVFKVQFLRLGFFQSIKSFSEKEKSET